LLTMHFVNAAPTGPSIVVLSNETKQPSSAVKINTTGGSITTIFLNATSQNPRWKAYVGNVTGTLVLQDSDGYNIYDWFVSTTISGTVIATRNTTLDWNWLNCTNATGMTIEQTDLEFDFSGEDNINHTFNSTAYSTITVNNKVLTGCPAVYTFANNNSRQGYQNSTALYPEILIQDNSSRNAYVAQIEQDEDDYSGIENSTHDFQLLVPDYGNLSNLNTVTYYFYVELT
jgi:hypothetical protein